MKYIRFICICLLCFFIPITFASNITFMGVENTTHVNQPIHLIFQGNISDYELQYQSTYDPKWYSVGNSGSSFIIPNSRVQAQGIYRFYLQHKTDNQTRFPKNTSFYIYANQVNDFFLNQSLEFGSRDSKSSGHEILASGSYEMANEIFQVKEIERFSLMYFLTGNETYKNITFELININWAGNCDPTQNDFSCSPGSGFQGSEKQGQLIYSLFQTQLYLQNKTFGDYAIEFANNNPSDCDVQSGNYVCGSNKGQGRMIQGFANAYLHTSNNSYKEILYGLINTSKDMNSTVDLAVGLSEAYLVLQNESIRQLAQEQIMSSIEDCLDDTCSDSAISSQYELLKYIPRIMKFENTSITDTQNNTVNISLYAYGLNRAFKLLNSNTTSGYCSYMREEYNCVSNYAQAYKTIGLYDFASKFPQSSIGFFDNQVLDVSLDSISIQTNFAAIVKNVTMYYKDVAETNFKNKSVSNYGFVQIPNDFGTQSLVLEYYFEDAQGFRYPHYNNTFIFVIPLSTQNLPSIFTKFNGFSLNAPLQYCDPFDNDSSCQYEYMHGKYMSALSKYAEYNDSTTEIVQLMHESIIDPDQTNSATCDPRINDFFCQSDPVNALNRPGITRGMNLIQGYTSFYTGSFDTDAIEFSQKLAYQSDTNSYVSCNIWQNSYECATSKEQYQYIHAIKELFFQTGDEILFEKLSLLTNELFDFSVDRYTTRGLIETYELFGNETFDVYINDYVQNQADDCLELFECSVEEFYENLAVVWMAYGLFEDSNYYNLGLNLLQSRPQTFRNRCDANADSQLNTFSCSDPIHQSVAIDAMYQSLQNFVQREPINVSVNISLDLPAKYDEIANATTYITSLYNQFNTTCAVTNHGSNAISFNLLVSSNLQINTTKYEITNLQPNNTTSVQFLVNSSIANQNSISCFVENFEDNKLVDVYINKSVLNVSLIHNITNPHLLQKNNNYSISLNISNQELFELQDIQLQLSEIGIIENITTTQDLVYTNTSVQIPVLLPGDNFNMTIYFLPFESYEGDFTITTTTAFNGSNIHNFPIRIDYDSFLITQNGTGERLYDKNILQFIINQTKAFNVSQLLNTILYNESLISIQNITLLHNDTLFGFTNNSFEFPLFKQNDSYVVTVSYTPLYQSAFYPIDIQLQLQTLNIFEQSTYSFNASRDLFTLTTNDITGGQKGEQKTTYITIEDATVNQTNVSLVIDSQDFLFFHPIELPFEDKYISQNVSQYAFNSTMGINTSSALVNLSNYDNQTVLLYVDNVTNNTEFGVFSYHNIQDYHSAQNISYTIRLQNDSSIPANTTLMGELQIFNESNSSDVYETFFCPFSGSSPFTCTSTQEYSHSVNSTLTLLFEKVDASSQENYSIFVDYINVNHTYTNRTYFAQIQSQTNSSVQILLYNLFLNSSYTFGITGDILSSGNISVIAESLEGGYVKTSGSV